MTTQERVQAVATVMVEQGLNGWDARRINDRYGWTMGMPGGRHLRLEPVELKRAVRRAARMRRKEQAR